MEVKSLTEQKSLLATLAPGKRARLRRLLFEFGPGNGTLMLLPIDQGIEHGPRDFFPNPASKDPEYQFRLAAEAGYSALACQIGMAEKYYPDYAGQVPLILKLPRSARAGHTIEEPVELVDVYPTVAGLLGIAPPASARAASSAPVKR